MENLNLLLLKPWPGRLVFLAGISRQLNHEKKLPYEDGESINERNTSKVSV